MGVYQYNPNPNAFVRNMRKVYHPLHFYKGYNFVLFFIFAGGLFGFCLARLEYFSINGLFKDGAAPGEWFYYKRSYYKAGISLHLFTIIPAGILATLQFVPVIRHKVLIFHRINGYLALLLLTCGVIGALMIARYAFGGTLATQALMGWLAIAVLGSALMAYINIKRLQIDQHRAWMLRTWFYAASIITLRVIMIISALIVSAIGNYYIAMPCRQVKDMGGDPADYAACRADPDAQTAVLANFNNKVEQVAAAMHMSFGMAGWLALILHAVGIEIYLKLTPAESERLRKVSYERQVERGLSHPGSSGLTVDRFGDAQEWKPSALEEKEEKHGADDAE